MYQQHFPKEVLTVSHKKVPSAYLTKSLKIYDFLSILIAIFSLVLIKNLIISYYYSKK
jgi:hypothetical protein